MWGRALIGGGTAVVDAVQTQVLYHKKPSWCLLANLANCNRTPDSVRSFSTFLVTCEKSIGMSKTRGIQKDVGIQCINKCMKTSLKGRQCLSKNKEIFSRSVPECIMAGQNITPSTDCSQVLGPYVSFSTNKCPKYSTEDSVLLPTGIQSSVRHLSTNSRGSTSFGSHILDKHLKNGSESCSVLPTGMQSSVRYISRDRGGFTGIHGRMSALQLKKRSQRKKKQIQDDSEEAVDAMEGFTPSARHKFLTFDPDFTLPIMQDHKPPPREWQVTAYATADDYNLDKLLAGLNQQGLYTASTMTSDATESSVLHAVATYRLETEQREIYFFREGSVVFWNVAELERFNVLKFLKEYEEGKYDGETVLEECESLSYKYSEGPSRTKLLHDKILLNPEGQTNLEKYTFSNALAMSVKLGIWEASLDKYIDNIEYVSEELSKTGHVVLTQDQVLQRMGQLFALRHLINLSSDLLDIPDFYWEHEQLEQLYRRTSDHLSVSKRTSVMNVKLNHCLELMELLKSHLNDRHSARLEWIIIILIMVEVAFELLHLLERLF